MISHGTVDFSELARRGEEKPGRALENLTKQLLIEEGFIDVELTGEGTDRGRDILFRTRSQQGLHGRKYVCQCKYRGSGNLNLTEIDRPRTPKGVMEEHHARGYLLVTNVDVTSSITDHFGSLNQGVDGFFCDYWNGAHVEGMLLQHEATLRQFFPESYASFVGSSGDDYFKAAKLLRKIGADVSMPMLCRIVWLLEEFQGISIDGLDAMLADEEWMKEVAQTTQKFLLREPTTEDRVFGALVRASSASDDDARKQLADNLVNRPEFQLRAPVWFKFYSLPLLSIQFDTHLQSFENWWAYHRKHCKGEVTVQEDNQRGRLLRLSKLEGTKHFNLAFPYPPLNRRYSRLRLTYAANSPFKVFVFLTAEDGNQYYMTYAMEEGEHEVVLAEGIKYPTMRLGASALDGAIQHLDRSLSEDMATLGCCRPEVVHYICVSVTETLYLKELRFI